MKSPVADKNRCVIALLALVGCITLLVILSPFHHQQSSHDAATAIWAQQASEIEQQQRPRISVPGPWMPLSGHAAIPAGEENAAARSVRIHFATFGSPGFECAINRIVREARYLGVFASVTAFTNEDIDPLLHRRILDPVKKEHTRGYGYWMWRPHLLMKKLREIPQDDFLQFADCGCTISPRYDSMVNDALYLRRTNGDLMAQRLEPIHTVAMWSKGDAFSLFNVTANTPYSSLNKRTAIPGKRLGDQPGIQATVLLLRNTPSMMALLQEWEKWMLMDDARGTTDAKSTHLTDAPEFKENRHDQTILGLMAYTGAPHTEGVRVRVNNMFVPGGDAAWKNLADTGVTVLGTRRKLCSKTSIFSPEDYDFVRMLRANGWAL